MYYYILIWLLKSTNLNSRKLFFYRCEYNSRNIIIREFFHFASDFKISNKFRILNSITYSIIQVVENIWYKIFFALMKIRKRFYYTYTESRIHLFWQMLSRIKLGQVILHGARINRGNLSRDRCSALISRLKQLARKRWIIKEQT